MTTKTVKKKAVKKKAAPKKKVVSKKAEKADELSLQIVATSKCPTLSGKNTITYSIEADDKNKIYFRIKSTSGGGFFSAEAVALDHITSVLGDVSGEHITSLHLFPLFKGRSVNSPGYLLAVLLKEGLLASVEDKKRKYRFVGTDKLLTKLKKTKK